jgi:hypothetical protein
MYLALIQNQVCHCNQALLEHPVPGKSAHLRGDYEAGRPTRV